MRISHLTLRAPLGGSSRSTSGSAGRYPQHIPCEAAWYQPRCIGRLCACSRHTSKLSVRGVRGSRTTLRAALSTYSSGSTAHRGAWLERHNILATRVACGKRWASGKAPQRINRRRDQTYSPMTASDALVSVASMLHYWVGAGLLVRERERTQASWTTHSPALAGLHSVSCRICSVCLVVSCVSQIGAPLHLGRAPVCARLRCSRQRPRDGRVDVERSDVCKTRKSSFRRV